jgi:cytoskeletal protein CcmA (bactofilin family)
MFSKKPGDLPFSPPVDKDRNMATRNGASATFSVLGTDLTITGNIAATADLHVDGTVEGDIACTSLVQGETSTIRGGVTAESARLAGRVTGSINARELVILRTARIEGDVHYDALTIEQGAQVEGRFARREDKPVVRREETPVARPQSPPELSVAS